MKKMALLLIATSCLVCTVPAFSQTKHSEKDMCLLSMKNCANQVDSIQEKIKKIDGEIKKGEKVYTPEELKQLEQKLEEVNQLLKSLEGGSK